MSWEKVALSEIMDLQNGFAFNSEDYVESSNVYNCRMSNIRPGGDFDIDYNPRFLPDEFAIKYSQFLLKEGDIIVAMTDLANDPKILGVPTIVNTNKKILLNQRVGKLIIKDEKRVFIPFLKYALNRKEVQKYFAKFSGGGLQINLGKNDLLSYTLSLPPLPIQKRIAEILDAADALKRKDQQLFQKCDELAQAIFIDMFGDPVKNEKGWEVKTINESIEFMTSGSRGWAQYYSESGDLFLRINNVGYNELKLQELIFVNAPNNAEAIRTEVKSGDILLSITADLGRTCVIPDDFPKAFINQHLAILRLKNSFEPVFVSQVLSSEYGKLQFRKLNKGGVKAGLNFDDIKSLEFINPPINYQRKYKKILQEVKKQFDTLILLNQQSNNLFQTLIQKAFKGELVA